MQKLLDRNQLKYIAIITMIMDHIAFLFISPFSTMYNVFRTLGKITAPIMCFFLAEGYNYTSSKTKYGIRLLIFAIISQFAFSLTFYNKLFTFNFNMIFTLLLSFIVLLSYEKIRNKLIKYIVIIALVLFSNFFDWGIFAPLWVLAFYLFRGKISRQAISYYIITSIVIIVKCVIINNYSWSNMLIQFGLFLFIPILYLYNGKKGNSNRFNKWFFYIFYPLHLIILYFV